MSKNKLEKLLKQLPDLDVDAQDLKAMAIQFIMDQEDDEVEEKRGTRSRLKLEALRLLHDIVKAEGGTDLDGAILAVIAGNKDEKEG